MSVWEELYKQHTASRRCARTWERDVRSVLKLLAKDHCDWGVLSRFGKARRAENGREEWLIHGGPEPMLLEGMKSATIQVLAALSRDHLHEFTITASGVRDDESEWVVAVHLHSDVADEENADRVSDGACSHAALHCHVGRDWDSLPNVRVPLPAMGPADALTWVLSQLVPGKLFEPAPWASIKSEPAGRR